MPLKHPKYIFIAAGAIFLVIAFILTRSNVKEARNMPRPVPRQVSVEHIASWMTIPYISRVYQVPQSDLFMAIGHDPVITPRDSIEALARRDHKNAAVLIEAIKQEIKRVQMQQ